MIQAEAPRDILPYAARITLSNRTRTTPLYPAFGVDANGFPRNIIGETVLALAGGARVKAIRKGDIPTAIGAAIVEQVVLDSARKSGEHDQTNVHWG